MSKLGEIDKPHGKIGVWNYDPMIQKIGTRHFIFTTVSMANNIPFIPRHPMVDLNNNRMSKPRFKFPNKTQTVDKLALEFDRLAKEWKSVVGPRSSVSSIVSHPAYLEIISHGKKIIPYILRDLQKEPNHWFVALYIAAGRFSPVRPEDAGNMKKMTRAWLDWGRENARFE